LTTFVFSFIRVVNPLYEYTAARTRKKEEREFMKKKRRKKEFIFKFFGSSSFLSLFLFFTTTETPTESHLSFLSFFLSLCYILHTMSFVVYHPSLMMN
tara:strand:+ start:2221 stop:2514 length:294 start_codon:yes stop_codon:yes gene_type:complete